MQTEPKDLNNTHTHTHTHTHTEHNPKNSPQEKSSFISATTGNDNMTHAEGVCARKEVSAEKELWVGVIKKEKKKKKKKKKENNTHIHTYTHTHTRTHIHAKHFNNETEETYRYGKTLKSN